MAVSVGDIVLISGNPITGRGMTRDLAVVKAVADANNNVLVESLTAPGQPSTALIPFSQIVSKVVPVAP